MYFLYCEMYDVERDRLFDGVREVGRERGVRGILGGSDGRSEICRELFYFIRNSGLVKRICGYR